jgi:hypothetical protein
MGRVPFNHTAYGDDGVVDCLDFTIIRDAPKDQFKTAWYMSFSQLILLSP